MKKPLQPDTWKSKAIARRLENKELKKRLKEVKHSRSNWKAKSMCLQSTVNNYKKEIEQIKKTLHRIII